MPSPSTAYDLIQGSMRLAGIIAPGDTPTSDESNDALLALNDLLESMSTENLFVYGQADQSFNTIAGTASYTIGVGGTFNTARPVRISDAICTVSGVDFPIDLIGQDTYNEITLKTQQAQIIEQLLYVNDYPLGRITLWPVPSAIVSLTLSIDRVLTQIAALATSISYPPGYLLFMKHALAMLIAPDYGVTLGDDVAGVARTMKAALKRANKKKILARFDSAITDAGPVTYQAGF